MSLIELGGALFFIGILFGWRYYEEGWRSNAGEIMGYVLCTVGSVLIIVGFISNLVERFTHR